MTRSPFRYPGGKARMATRILDHIPESLTSYCEPFVGGGGVLIAVLDRLANHRGLTITLNDSDQRMAAWWRVIANRDESGFKGLIAQIQLVDPTVSRFNLMQREWGAFVDTEYPDWMRAFAAIFLNRCSYSGIMNAGPIGGQNQLSKYTVDCRWNPERLLINHRALRALLLNHVVRVTEHDFRRVIKDSHPDTFLYVDPPYKTPGPKLYQNNLTDDDHEELSVLLHGRDNWLLSYDDHPWVRARYADCRIEDASTYYTITNKRPLKIDRNELLIYP